MWHTKISIFLIQRGMKKWLVLLKKSDKVSLILLKWVSLTLFVNFFLARLNIVFGIFVTKVGRKIRDGDWTIF
jgi:cytochrome bd-type quinol oxidase subunit 1